MKMVPYHFRRWFSPYVQYQHEFSHVYHAILDKIYQNSRDFRVCYRIDCIENRKYNRSLLNFILMLYFVYS